MTLPSGGQNTNPLKILSFFSGLTGRLSTISRNAQQQDPDLPVSIIFTAFEQIFGRFSTAIDGVNTTTSIDGQTVTPLQRVTNSTYRNRLLAASSHQVATMPISSAAAAAVTTAAAPPPTPAPTTAPPQTPSYLKNFTDYVNSITITDPKLLIFLEQIVAEVDSSVGSHEIVEIERELLHDIIPSFIQANPGAALMRAVSIAGNILPKIGGLTLAKSLPFVRNYIKQYLGLEDKDIDRLKTDNVANLIRSLLNLFIEPLRKKIVADRTLLETTTLGEMKEINTRASSLNVTIANKLAQGTATIEQIKLTTKQIQEEINHLKTSIAECHAKLQNQIAQIEARSSRIADTNPSDISRIKQEMEENVHAIAAMTISLKESVTRLINTEKSVVQTTTKAIATHLRSLSQLNTDSVDFPSSLEEIIAKIEASFPHDFRLSGNERASSLHELIKSVRDKLASFAPSPPPPPPPPPSTAKVGALGWLWNVGKAVVTAPVKLVTTAVQLTGQAVGHAWRNNVTLAPFNRLVSFLQQAQLESQALKSSLDTSTIVADVDAITKEADHLVELETQKQKAEIILDVKTIDQKQINSLTALRSKIKVLEKDHYTHANSFLKFIHRFFNTKTYRAHNVLEAEAQVKQAKGERDVINTANISAVLEAQEKLDNALGKLDHTATVGSSIGQIRATLKDYEQHHPQRASQPPITPVVTTPQPVLPTAAAQTVSTTPAAPPQSASTAPPPAALFPGSSPSDNNSRPIS